VEGKMKLKSLGEKEERGKRGQRRRRRRRRKEDRTEGGGGRKMEQKHMAWRNHKLYGFS
jgi:hypothetical protein